MTGEIAIEPAGLAQAELLSALLALCVEPGWSVDSIASFLAAPGSFARLAASDHGKVASGFILWRCAAGSCDIAAMGVVPEMRRRGVGRALLRAAMAEAKAQGAGEMFLEVADSNAPARSLYAREGFEPVGRRAGYYRSGAAASDALVLRRAL